MNIIFTLVFFIVIGGVFYRSSEVHCFIVKCVQPYIFTKFVRYFFSSNIDLVVDLCRGSAVCGSVGTPKFWLLQSQAGVGSGAATAGQSAFSHRQVRCDTFLLLTGSYIVNIQ